MINREMILIWFWYSYVIENLYLKIKLVKVNKSKNGEVKLQWKAVVNHKLTNHSKTFLLINSKWWWIFTFVADLTSHISACLSSKKQAMDKHGKTSSSISYYVTRNRQNNERQIYFPVVLQCCWLGNRGILLLRTSNLK